MTCFLYINQTETELLAEETTQTESIEGAIPEITDVPNPPQTENVVVLADQPAMLTVTEENRIQEQLEAERDPEELQPQIAETETEAPLDEAQQDTSPPSEIETDSEPETTQSEQENAPESDPEPEEEPEPTPPAAPANAMPSLLKVDARCQYSVQLGEYSALQNAFQRAESIESSNLSDIMQHA